MFSKLLVANRGEIAVRVMRACREMGIATVAVYSEADARALHVLSADEAVCIGPPPAVDSYLNIPAIIEAARATGAEAVHPGYGFLSENPDFADACIAAGLIWVGPPPAAMRAMAHKIEARRLAAALGVPLLPGYEGSQDEDTLAREAERIGYPVLIKASAGGGGRGMRVVESPAAFTEALAGARREARSAFGDDAMLLERYLRRPRHIEFQVFGDQQGTVVHLGERECSVQRRHQKVIEEAPSPALTDALRVEMGAAAVRLARAIGYTSAGTVEFILDEQGRFAFLEMNTRLQVEHGVTELVTGLDLVQLQIRVACGEPLPFGQDDVQRTGHAIQCRVYAENPAEGYLPSPGRLTRFVPPAGPGIRNDIGVYEGFEVTSHYDSLLAKLLVAGADRDEAIARAAEALDRYQVDGVVTNLSLLSATVRHPEFAAGHTFTSFLEEHVLPIITATAIPAEALIGAAAYDLLTPALAPGDPWSAGPWRQSGMAVRLTYRGRHDDHAVDAVRLDGAAWELSVGGAARRVTLEPLPPPRVLVRDGTRVLAFDVTEDGDRLMVTHGGRTVILARGEPPSIQDGSHGAASAGGAGTIAAPLAGIIVKVSVTEGERVRPGQPLVVLEAMKMEHAVDAPAAAIVRGIRHAVGDRVQAGDVLIDLESA